VPFQNRRDRTLVIVWTASEYRAEIVEKAIHK
jgi:hypothetical protein